MDSVTAGPPQGFGGVRVHPLDTSTASPELLEQARLGAAPSTSQMAEIVIQLIFITAVWEILYRVLRAFAFRAYGVLKDRETAYWVEVLLPSHGVSTIHALYMAWAGSRVLYRLWDAPTIDKIFLSYLLYDVAHVIAEYPKLGGRDTIAHHAAYMMASIIAGLTRTIPFAFGWLILTELSTPFLNFRWLIKSLRKMGSPRLVRFAERWGTTTAMVEHKAGMAFFLSFTAVRLLSYGVFLAHLLYSAYGGVLDVLGRAQLWVLLGLVTVGWLMNVFWWRMLNGIITRSRRRLYGTPGDVQNGSSSSKHRGE